MACDDIQLLDPQVLGIRGDPAYDENGTYALTLGEDEVTIEFIYEKATAAYIFEALYIKDSNDPPQDIRAVVITQGTKSFTVKLSGAPTTTTCTLVWHVMRPDPLQVNQPLTPGPSYAIVRPYQRGVKNMTINADFVQVNFPQPMPDNDWGFDQLSIENVGDPIQACQTFSWTVSVHDTTHFRIELSGKPDTSTYKLRWQVS